MKLPTILLHINLNFHFFRLPLAVRLPRRCLPFCGLHRPHSLLRTPPLPPSVLILLKFRVIIIGVAAIAQFFDKFRVHTGY
ncbi:hypothetical protein ACS0TY_023664 [Phlomoides rotata]